MKLFVLAGKIINWSNNERQKQKTTYEVSGAACPVNNKVRHVSNEVRSQSQVEEHVKDVEEHLSGVFSMQVPVTGSCQCCDRPVKSSYISVPKTIFFEIWVYCSNPGSFWIGVSVCNQIVYASSKVYSIQGYLRSTGMGG